MNRSARFRDAVSALDDHRLERSSREPDLFSAVNSVAEHEGDEWRAAALAALRVAAEQNTELTVEDVDWPPALDARARGAILLEGARRGWLQRCGYVSGGAGRHGRPVVLWASTIFDPSGRPGAPGRDPLVHALDAVELESTFDLNGVGGGSSGEPRVTPEADEPGLVGVHGHSRDGTALLRRLRQQLDQVAGDGRAEATP